MTPQTPETILYLGRHSATADALRSLLADGAAQRATGSATGSASGSALHLEQVTNQKCALDALQGRPRALLLVETTARPESRCRFCQTVRLRAPAVPIVAVTAAPPVAYHFAFDAVLRWPLDAPQALAALRLTPPDTVLRRGPVALDVAARRVQSPQGEHTVTPLLCSLLRLLMEQAGQVVRRAEIMQRVWETSYLDDTRTLDVHIRWLRRLIEPDPADPVYLQTRRGEGYVFVVPDGQ